MGLDGFYMQATVHQKTHEAGVGSQGTSTYKTRLLPSPISGIFFQNILSCVPGRRVELNMTHLQRCSARLLLGRRQTLRLARFYPHRSAHSWRNNLKNSLLSCSPATSSVALG